MSSAELNPQPGLHQLYNDHHGWLRGWLRKRLNCSETAADLAQDTFVRVMQRHSEGVFVQKPRAYLSHIAQGLVINHWRRRDIQRA